MDSKNTALRFLPSVEALLSHPDMAPVIDQYGKKPVKATVRKILNRYRSSEDSGIELPDTEKIIADCTNELGQTFSNGLRRVINASGILIHTNLGRSPLGTELFKNAENKLSGYNNLEFDLEKGRRGSRHDLIAGLVSYLTHADDALVVNNNAAAILLILKSLAEGKEVIVSRSELIEIGGSFRLPEIMKAAGCILHEVGTSNKTHLADYEKAINENTALIFKTHKSNYTIKGFTNEIDIKDLAILARKKHIPLVFDLGSGLPFAQKHPLLKNEPNVKQALADGASLVCFSGDKLLGGPQAGLIAGKKKLVARLKKEQLTRALRVGKLTLAFLEGALMNYLSEEKLKKSNRFYQLLYQTEKELRDKAGHLSEILRNEGIKHRIVDDYGFFGGGTLPDEKITSYSIELDIQDFLNGAEPIPPRLIYLGLLKQKPPILSVLKKRKIYLNVLCLMADEAEEIVHALKALQTELTSD